jgi:hypothetical protein
MPAIRDDVQKGCSETAHIIADLAREAVLLYPRLSGAVNGNWVLKQAEEETIRRIISSWQVEQKIRGMISQSASTNKGVFSDSLCPPGHL